jgi:hypothetical protein
MTLFFSIMIAIIIFALALFGVGAFLCSGNVGWLLLAVPQCAIAAGAIP